MGEQLDYSFQHYGDFGWSFLFLVPLLIIVVLVLYVIIYLINIGVKNKLLKKRINYYFTNKFGYSFSSFGISKKP